MYRWYSELWGQVIKLEILVVGWTEVSYTETWRGESRLLFWFDWCVAIITLAVSRRSADEGELQKLPYRPLVFPMGMLVDGWWEYISKLYCSMNNRADIPMVGIPWRYIYVAGIKFRTPHSPSITCLCWSLLFIHRTPASGMGFPPLPVIRFAPVCRSSNIATPNVWKCLEACDSYPLRSSIPIKEGRRDRMLRLGMFAAGMYS